MNKRTWNGMTLRILPATLALVAWTFGAAAADWPWFLGRDRNDTSRETGLARSWPEEGPRVLWTLPLGVGYGGAAVRDGKVYVLDRVDNARDVLRVHDLETGREEWTFAYDSPGKLSFNGSRSVPTVTKNRVFITGAMGDVHCIDIKTRKVVWKRHMIKDFEGAKLPVWGIGYSPRVYKGWVLLPLHNSGAGLVALDRKTGATVWQSPANPLAEKSVGNYMTPHVLTLDGVDQVVLCSSDESDEKAGTSRGRIFGFSATDGRVLWTIEGFTGHLVYPIPVGPDRILMTSSYPPNTKILEVKRSTKEGGPEFMTGEVVDIPDLGAQLHVPILHEGHIYLNGNSNKRRDGLVCLTLEGEMLWQSSNSRKLPTYVAGSPNFGRGNMILADGMLFILDGVKGNLHLVDPNPKGYTELAQAHLLEGKEIWAPMALSNGKLLIRDKKQMKCLDVRKP